MKLQNLLLVAGALTATQSFAGKRNVANSVSSEITCSVRSSEMDGGSNGTKNLEVKLGASETLNLGKSMYSAVVMIGSSGEGEDGEVPKNSYNLHVAVKKMGKLLTSVRSMSFGGLTEAGFKTQPNIQVDVPLEAYDDKGTLFVNCIGK